MADLRIGVEGARELRRELKALEGQWPKALRDTNFAVADRVVVPVARRNAARQPRVRAANPRPSRQHWADYVASHRALASQTRATVALGSARVPWATGTNFGSKQYAQFGPPRHPDHALYKAIASERPKVIETYGEMLGNLTKRAFPD